MRTEWEQWEVGQTSVLYYWSPWISGAAGPRGASCHNSPDCTAFRNACRVHLSMMRGHQWCHHHPFKMPPPQLHILALIPLAIPVQPRGVISTNALWWQLDMQDLLSTQALPTVNLRGFSWLLCSDWCFPVFTLRFPSLPGAVQWCAEW